VHHCQPYGLQHLFYQESSVAQPLLLSPQSQQGFIILPDETTNSRISTLRAGRPVRVITVGQCRDYWHRYWKCGSECNYQEKGGEDGGDGGLQAYYGEPIDLANNFLVIREALFRGIDGGWRRWRAEVYQCDLKDHGLWLKTHSCAFFFFTIYGLRMQFWGWVRMSPACRSGKRGSRFDVASCIVTAVMKRVSLEQLHC